MLSDGPASLPVGALVATGIALLAVHAILALGWRSAATLFVTSLLVGYGVENLALRTGIPFGHYVFRLGAGFPHVGRAPLVLGPLYFALAYVAWSIASLLLSGRISRPDTSLLRLAGPGIAALVATQADLVFDPVGSTLCRAWVWRDGGADFGVPISNYIGLLLTFWGLLQAFALTGHRERSETAAAASTFIFQGVPVALFLAAGLSQLPVLFVPDTPLFDGAGRAWSAADLRQTSALVMLLTMVPSSLLALLQLGRGALAPTDPGAFRATFAAAPTEHACGGLRTARVKAGSPGGSVPHRRPPAGSRPHD